jgi:hypothetical protein
MNRKPHLNRSLIWNQAIRLFSVALLTLLVTGCVSVNRLHEAQDSFNQAAAAENAARLDANPSAAAASLVSVRAGYASALLSLAKLEPKDEQSLQQDGLWSTALTLKALCQWRLGQYNQALDSANAAQTTTTNQLYPRDRALLVALPGLIKTDQAYAKIFSNAPMAEVEALLTGPNGAIADIQNARALTDTNHPVQIYLIQAQLAAYRNFTVALERLRHTTVPPDSSPRSNAIVQLRELDHVARVNSSDPAQQNLAVFWGHLIGISQF